MSDLQVLTLFRLAQANGTIHKLTKTTHDCASNSCDSCTARPACSFIAGSYTLDDFDSKYLKWASRTPLLTLRQLEQHYPEHLI